jgi:hypothetical protein
MSCVEKKMRALLLAILLCFASATQGADIATPVPGHLDYAQTIRLMQTWEQKVPHLMMLAPIGNSQRGAPIYAIRLTNENHVVEYKERVLVVAGIHGNEPLSTAVVTGWLGTVLKDYGSTGHEYLVDFLNKREVYIIPVASPDSYLHSRFVDGVDPNRNFYQPYPCYPVACLKRFATQQKFSAVLCVHSCGRKLLYPYGDTPNTCPHDRQYNLLVDAMGKMSGYNKQKLSDLYGEIILGSGTDWYYRALGSCTLTMELGTHESYNQIPTYAAIQDECYRTYYSALYFIRMGPSALKPITWPYIQEEKPDEDESDEGAVGDAGEGTEGVQSWYYRQATR